MAPPNLATALINIVPLGFPVHKGPSPIAVKSLVPALPFKEFQQSWNQLESTFIDVKNRHLHQDSNPGLWNTVPML